MSDYGFVPTSRRLPSYQKDVSDTVDYEFGWVEIGNDSILTSTWASDDLSIVSSAVDGVTTNVTVSGGSAGIVTNLTNTITTLGGRTLQRSVYISVEEL